MVNAQVYFIDIQNDFMNIPGAALPVPGANADAIRAAALVDRVGHKLSDVHVSFDTHFPCDYRHPVMWTNERGEHPLPITQGGNLITASDMRAGIWTPKMAKATPPVLGGKTVLQFMIECAEARAAAGIPGMEIWPEHCIRGDKGWLLQHDLNEALKRWERKQCATINPLMKGQNIYTEHYGVMEAEYPIAADPTTGLNTTLLNVLTEADILGFGGQARTHCVRTSLRQVVNYFEGLGNEYLRKIWILTDLMSDVPAVKDPNGNIIVDFPGMADQEFASWKSKGVNFCTSLEFLT